MLRTKKALTLDLAARVAAAARAEAARNGWCMCFAVVDDGANLLYFERMDGAPLGSIQVAIEKSRSAALFRRPTRAFEEAVAGGRAAVLKLAGAVPLEGGVPLMAGEDLLGAIGASGATAAQDGQAASAGAAELQSLLAQK
jgi:glc operon protein GlcG